MAHESRLELNRRVAEHREPESSPENSTYLQPDCVHQNSRRQVRLTSSMQTVDHYSSRRDLLCRERAGLPDALFSVQSAGEPAIGPTGFLVGPYNIWL